jgi:hypothetical protein
MSGLDDTAMQLPMSFALYSSHGVHSAKCHTDQTRPLFSHTSQVRRTRPSPTTNAPLDPERTTHRLSTAQTVSAMPRPTSPLDPALISHASIYIF